MEYKLRLSIVVGGQENSAHLNWPFPVTFWRVSVAALSSRDLGETSLHLVASRGHNEATWLVLAHGANKEAKMDKERTAHDLAK